MRITISSAAMIWLCLLISMPAMNAQAQSGVAEAQVQLREAARRRAAGDDDGAIRALETARALNPASLYTRYNLAAAYARRGDAQRALDLLEALARARVDFGLAQDEDFAALATLPAFQAIMEQLAANTAPAVRSKILFELQRIDLVPEGIAWDASGARLFFGSMRTGEVFVMDNAGQLTKFAGIRDEQPLAAIGMTVDTTRGLLWVVGAPSFLTETQADGETRRAGVFAFDLATGDEIHRFLRDDAGYGYNDVTVAANGDVYLSGERLGVLRGGEGPIRTLVTSQPVYGSNGIVVTPDGEHLVTAAYPSGIAVVRLADGLTRFLPAPEGIELYGIDGLYLYNGDLIAVQNGIKPWRLMRFTLDDDLTAITAARAIDFANPFMTATTGAIVADEIRLIGQAPPAGDPPSHAPAALHEYLGRTVIMTAPLD